MWPGGLEGGGMNFVLANGVGAAVLLFTAAAKLARPRDSRDALGSYGLAAGRQRGVAWTGLVVVELALGVGIAAGSAAASYAAAVLMLAFAAALVGQILHGHAGLPCGCFGARSRIGWTAVVRNVALAGFYAALPWLADPHLAATGWLAVGLIVALAAVAALAVAVLALAREVGGLRLAVAPQSALELAHEGPEIGSRVELDGWLSPRADARLGLAVFTSASCPVCRALEPSIGYLARDPLVTLGVFDEQRHGEVWGMLDVPGSPYAVALGRDGTVLAKGTFNSFAQLESIVATAMRRRQEALSA